MGEVRRPCPTCPWRVDRDASTIPGFSLEKAERLDRTCPNDHGRGSGPNFGDPVFACHQSRPGEEVVCAGWLAVFGGLHPNMRLAVCQGRIDPAALSPGEGWPELHQTFEEFIEKMRATA